MTDAEDEEICKRANDWRLAQLTKWRKSKMRIGVKVKCNGYEGTITEICVWDENMLGVRLPGGLVCVSRDNVEILSPSCARCGQLVDWDSPNYNGKSPKCYDCLERSGKVPGSGLPYDWFAGGACLTHLGMIKRLAKILRRMKRERGLT